MALYKAIEHNKELRRQYTGAKLHSCSCRNHGGCPWCLSNRLHKNRIREQQARYKLIET